MRENRQSGSEGGVGLKPYPYPYRGKRGQRHFAHQRCKVV